MNTASRPLPAVMTWAALSGHTSYTLEMTRRDPQHEYDPDDDADPSGPVNTVFVFFIHIVFLLN